MTRLQPYFVAVVGVALLLAVAPHDVLAQSRQRSSAGTNARPDRSERRSEIDTTFAFDTHGSVTVNTSNGDIAVTGWSRNEVHLRVESADETVRFNSWPNRMSLNVSTTSRGSDARFEISVPYGVRVLATTSSGDIVVRGTQGQVEGHSQSGDIHVEDVSTRLDVGTFSGDLTAAKVRGDVEVQSVSGDVGLSDVRGNVDVGSVSGSIELSGVTTKLVRARTTSGDVSYSGTVDPAGRYELTAHSGDIRLHIPRDASAQLYISTWSGGIDSDFPITLTPGEHGIGLARAKRFTFEIGGGAARISAETFSGDVTISSDGRGASPPD